MMIVRWIGDMGYVPMIGLVNHGLIVALDDDMAESCIEQGLAERYTAPEKESKKSRNKKIEED